MKRKRSTDCPARISECLDSVVEEILPERGRLKRIMALWKEILGEKIFLHARPSSIRKGILYVTVSDPVWLSEMHYFGDKLISGLNSVLGESEKIKEIRYKVGYLEGVRPEADEKLKNMKQTEHFIEELSPELRESVINVQDDSLRNILTKIAFTIEQRKKEK